VPTSIVDDIDFSELPPNAKLVFFYLKLLLGPAGIGVIYNTTLAEQLGMAMESLSDAIGMLIDRGWIRMESRIVWVCNGLRDDPGVSLSNVKHRVSVVRHAESLPKLQIVLDFAAYYGLEISTQGYAIRNPLDRDGNGRGIPPRITEDRRQNTEEGKQKTEEVKSGVGAPTYGNTSIEVSDLVDKWDNVLGATACGTADAHQYTDVIRIENILKDPVFRDNIDKILDTIKNTPFLLGLGEKGWVCTFKWLTSNDNYLKILSGKYGYGKARNTDRNNYVPTESTDKILSAALGITE